MKEILDAIKWYHLFFPFAFVFIFLFKNQLSDLISRITSIDEKGLKADPPPESQQEKTKTTDEVVQQLLDSVGNSKVIQDQVKTIQEALEGEGLSTEGDSEKVLIKHLAGIQLLLAFEQIQSSIFGSQIILLKKLNEVAGQGIREDDAPLIF